MTTIARAAKPKPAMTQATTPTTTAATATQPANTAVATPKTLDPIVLKDGFENGGTTDPSVSQAMIAEIDSANPATAPNVKKGLSNTEAAAAGASGVTDPAANQNILATSPANKLDPVEHQKVMDAQYDYLSKLVTEKANGDPNAWKTGEGELNLIGLRSVTNNQINAGEADKYNDTIYACRIKDGKKEVYAFDATVDAGKWDQDRAMETGMAVVNKKGDFKGVAHLADGFYQEAFKKGAVSGSDMGLKQAGWLRYQLDKNGDGTISDDEKLGKDGQGKAVGASARFQFHPGWGENVGENSAGCQTIRGEQWGKFQELLGEVPDSQKRFSYTLADGHNLPTAETIDQDVAQIQKNWVKNSFKVFGNEVNIYNRDAINSWNETIARNAEQKNQSAFLWLNPDATGRGFSEGEDDSQVLFTKETDAVVKAFMSYTGEDGIGIIRQPLPSFSRSSWIRKWYM